MKIRQKSNKLFLRTFKWIFASLAVIFIIIIISINFIFPLRFKDIVMREAIDNSLDENLIYAVIWTESKFNESAISNKGAMGLMQLMPSTAKWCAEMLEIEYNQEKLLQKEYNIKLATFYLKYLIDKYGESDAIIAYNAGEGNLLHFKNQTKEIFKETKDYAKRVKITKTIYKILYNN